MSRFDEYDGDEQFPNQRALKGKRGRKALSEMREALRMLPEKRLIQGALCTVGGVEQRVNPEKDPRGGMTPEGRYDAFMRWLDEQLEEAPNAA